MSAQKWYPMHSAPKNRPIRLSLQDGFGPNHTYAFGPAKWSKEKECWIHAPSGTPIKPKIVGWRELSNRVE